MAKLGVGLVLAVWTSGLLAACGGGRGQGDGTVDLPGDIGGESRRLEISSDRSGADAIPPACGDGVCNDKENCLHCPGDCECSCGDGACTHGEFCAVCPEDCDCTTVAATPPMGWNSWNLFACDIDENLAREMAQAMVDSGMAAVGYRYVNLDDCWQVDRGEDGVIIEDPERFPSGMGALAEEVHKLGLRFGLYTCAGPLTCEERPGSFGFEDVDAKTYAGWGVDYVKVDWCYAEEMNARERYGVFRDAIANSGRSILLSICNWGFQDPWVWGPETGAMWRTSGDIKDNLLAMTYTLLSAEPLASFARIGHWNDPDMLEVGNGGMTPEQYRAHFSLWAILAAPLIAGNDLRTMSQETKDILLNEEVIAVDQDPAGLQGVIVDQQGPVKVYARPLTGDGLRAVVLLNTDTDEVAKGRVRWDDIGLAPGGAAVRDLWSHADLGEFSAEWDVDLQPATAVMVNVLGAELLPPAGESPLGEVPWKYLAAAGDSLRKNKCTTGAPMSMDGKAFETGVSVQGAMRLVVHLGHRCTRFEAVVGIDDAALNGGTEGGVGEGGAGTATFQVKADGEVLFETGVVGAADDSVPLSVDLTGRRELELLVSPAGDSTDGDLADWAGATLKCGE